MAGVRQCHRLDGSARGHYEALPVKNGIYQSEIFPGLWLDADAMIRGDVALVHQVLQNGVSFSRAQIFSRTFAETHLMSLNLRWVGEADLDRVADTRVLCYAHSRKDWRSGGQYIHNQGRLAAGDYLLAERDGRGGWGRRRSLRLNMWVRGSAVRARAWRMWGRLRPNDAGREWALR